MKPWFRFSLIVLALVVAALACSSGSPPAQQPASGETLFEDDFSNLTSGWDRITDTDGLTDYVDGKYKITVNIADTDVWANPGKKFDNVVIKVTAAKVSGTDDNDYGVICRYVDSNNFYFFVISSDGYYGIGKVKDGKHQLVNREEMLPSEAIRRGEGNNTLQAVCDGSTLSFYVNGELLDTQTDAEFMTGDVGLIAGTFGEAGVEVTFDDFRVKTP
jgi:hypothetical protein